MSAARWSFPLDSVPDGAQARSVRVDPDVHQGTGALRVRLTAAVERDGVPGVDYIDQPTFLALPVHFRTGRIEVSVAAETHADAPEYARGFAGIAFGIDDAVGTFECVYIRPCNGTGLLPPPPRDRHAVQYFAYPDWSFDVLRERWPDGPHESPADVRPGQWHRLAVSVTDDHVAVEVDGIVTVDTVRLHRGAPSGAVGIWVDIGTRAWFADLYVSESTRRLTTPTWGGARRAPVVGTLGRQPIGRGTMSPRAESIAQQGELTRAAALDAAVELFGANGYRGTSLNQIARAAGVVQSALHHHFGSKEGLLAAALEAHYPTGQHRPDMAAIAAGETDFVDEMLRAVRHNVDDPVLVRFFSVMTGESLTEDHPAHAFFEERYRRVRHGFTEAILRARGVAGPSARGRIDRAVTVLVGTSDGLQMQWLRDPSVDLVGGVELVADLVRAEIAAAR
ncbi:TetR/AcrR family transcriptional regulator [Curtobacterium sp. TC1]|uniref:TetR/AcrR family transcriptional regulator n=1 Tax=Curtobacterium sp. TC1 TaxID=2862880 RepID=UPI001C9AF9A2|nr:TetR/AcrR family transcriptional regulator [Curtobacterium sp. TC1]QZQ53855.1 TetR/AcrR family transcriptional regulator [Curtobacterium sp. TC1]